MKFFIRHNTFEGKASFASYRFFLLLLAMVITLSFSSSFAEDTEVLKEKFFNILGIEQPMKKDIVKYAPQSVEKTLKNKGWKTECIPQEFYQEINHYVSDVYFPEYIKQFKKIFFGYFTIEEIQKMTEFYATEAGQKILKIKEQQYLGKEITVHLSEEDKKNLIAYRQSEIGKKEDSVLNKGNFEQETVNKITQDNPELVEELGMKMMAILLPYIPVIKQCSNNKTVNH